MAAMTPTPKQPRINGDPSITAVAVESSPNRQSHTPSFLDRVFGRFRRGSSSTWKEEEAHPAPEDEVRIMSETSPLLIDTSLTCNGLRDGVNDSETDECTRSENVTWQSEAKVIAGTSATLIPAFLLQQSLTVASVFAVGHIGTIELASVSLASMTANITGYAIYQGLATSLDTLCAQAYGSGRKDLVGIHTQRMVYFLWMVSVPIGIVWLFLAEPILEFIVPDPAIAQLASLYLRIVFLGNPGFTAFEAIKRFVQAQGFFSAPLYVLIVCAPLNALMNYIMVWKLNWGFVGAPIAVAITNTLLPVVLILYIRFFSASAMSCWTGFSRKALQNWGPMIRLALPGVLMMEAEVLAFEIVTLAASRFGATILAAQSVLGTLCLLEFQVPFSLSIASSTRIATHIGAALIPAAKISSRVTILVALVIGLINMTLFISLRDLIPRLFSTDPEVISIVSELIPLFAAFQIFDALATSTNGILRGLGRQEIGGYVQIFCYYLIGMPLSFGLSFGSHWGLYGLWTGIALALASVSFIQLLYISQMDWKKSIEDARLRNQETGT